MEKIFFLRIFFSFLLLLLLFVVVVSNLKISISKFLALICVASSIFSLFCFFLFHQNLSFLIFFPPRYHIRRRKLKIEKNLRKSERERGIFFFIEKKKNLTAVKHSTIICFSRVCFVSFRFFFFSFLFILFSLFLSLQLFNNINENCCNNKIKFSSYTLWQKKKKFNNNKKSWFFNSFFFLIFFIFFS